MGLALAAPHKCDAQMLFNVGLGAAVPIGSSADRLDTGYNALIAFSFRPSWTRNLVRFEAAVNSMSDKNAVTKRDIRSETANIVFLGARTDGPIGYVIVGAGSYQTAGASGRHSDPGLNVGAGVRFALGFVGTFVEARLHYIADDGKTKYFPMVFGLTF